MEENIIKNTGAEGNAATGTEGVEGNTLPKTQEELEALLQAEGDRRVSQALKKAQAKSDAKVKEAQKLAKMNADEQYQYELEQREKAIEEREHQLALLENTNEASKILSEKGLSLKLVDLVVADDAETMNANIQLLDRAFKASVKAEVEKRLGHSAPNKEVGSASPMTKKDFDKLSIMEKAQLKREDPDLYNSFKTIV